MLTRVYIDNFRSFQNFEYIPEKKQLLLGVNGSGKSSLLEALRSLKSFVNGDSNPFSQSTRTRWTDSAIQVFEIEAVLDGKTYAYRLELGYEAATKVTLERLRVDGRSVFELAEGRIRFFTGSTSPVAVPLQSNRSMLHFSVLSNEDVRRFVNWLSKHLHCFDFDLYPNEMSDVAEEEEQEPDFELGNMASWYLSLVTSYPDKNVKFLASLQRCMDGFLALKYSAREEGVRKLLVDFTSPAQAKVSYAISELSPGQRALIALYAILHFTIKRGDTVFIDEPDNFIALSEIQPWLLSAEEAVEDHGGQLILVSHHPETLNQWARDYGLRFFRELNGQVRTARFMPEETGLSSAELVARGWE